MKLWQKNSDLQVAKFPEDINEDDAGAIANLLASDGWKALERELNRRLRVAGRTLVGCPPEELEGAQGYYKGFEAALATPYDVLNALQPVPEDEVDIETEFYAKQQMLGDQRQDSY